MVKGGFVVFLTLGFLLGWLGLLIPVDSAWVWMLYLLPPAAFWATLHIGTRSRVADLHRRFATLVQRYTKQYGTGGRFLRKSVGMGANWLAKNAAADWLDDVDALSEEVADGLGDGIGLVAKGAVAVAGELWDLATKPREQLDLENQILAAKGERDSLRSDVATGAVGALLVSLGAGFLASQGTGTSFWDQRSAAASPPIAAPPAVTMAEETDATGGVVSSQPKPEPALVRDQPPSPKQPSEPPRTVKSNSAPDPDRHEPPGPVGATLPVLSHQAPGLVSLGDSVRLGASVEGDCTVALWYRADGKWALRRMEGPGEYQATLQVTDDLGNSLDYYLVATCASGETTSGSREAPHQVMVF